jgi:DNA polymerase III subunit alpha
VKYKNQATFTKDEEKSLYSGMNVTCVVLKNEIFDYNAINYLEDRNLSKLYFFESNVFNTIYNVYNLISKDSAQDINISANMMVDLEIYKLIISGQNEGIYQLKSPAIRRLITKLSPSILEELIFVLAYYHSNRLNKKIFNSFINRKYGYERINYFFKEFEKPLKPILESTHGLIIYQEQIMEILHIVGGFSLEKSDYVRRELGKKKLKAILKYESEFSQGALKKGFTLINAVSLFQYMVECVVDCSLKSHFVREAMITYKTAYLKYHYSIEFMSTFQKMNWTNLL